MEKNKKERILFVDDEDGVLVCAQEYFKFLGYEAHIAKNGVEALKVLEKHKIDCCFTDINMPLMDGFELAENVRKMDNTIPVIVMTGYPTLKNALRTLKNGVVDFIIKPAEMKKLEVCLQRVMRERRLFKENLLLKQDLEDKTRMENLNRELLFKVNELNILNKILTEFNGIKNSFDVFKRVVDMILEITHADVSMFFVVNGSIHEPVEVAVSPGYPGYPDHPDPAPPALIEEIASDGLPLLLSENNGWRGMGLEIQSFMAAPLTIREQVFGVVTATAFAGRRAFTEKDLYYLSNITRNAAQAIENLALYENIYDNLFTTLHAFVDAIEARDLYTRQHSRRVTSIAAAIAAEMGRSSEEIEILKFAGPLHDIGKIGVRDEILLKSGPLTEEEFEKIKAHPAIGANILKRLGFWEKENQIIRCHHERYDGAGYPDGLKGEEIPLLARILSVADCYDAMASGRTYMDPMPEAEYMNHIRADAGSRFDPDVVDAFLKIHHEGKIAPHTIKN
ncbi:MAG: response regulator [Desulfobacterales bacterium]|nr:response regulator [Desulfobacterales bacterium]